VRIFKTKPFARFAKRSGIGDLALCETIRDAERGLLAADLGGGVIKQRIARPGRGKSGGFRTLIVLRRGVRAVFVHGFAKNEKDNIARDEWAALKKLAAELLSYDERALARSVESGALLEVICHEKAVP
jgi:hypothetical protein